MKRQLVELCSLLTFVNPVESEITRCRQLLQATCRQLVHQQQFFEYARLWKLAPIIHIQLMRLELLGYLAEEVQLLFLAEYNHVKLQNEARNRAAELVLLQFNQLGIESVILKGNCLAHTVYHDIGYKRMNDFDLLIRKQDWEEIQAVYLSSGYIPLGFGWSGEKEKPARFSHVGMAFISPDFSCILGSQWGLKSPTTRYRDQISKAWDTAEPFSFYKVKSKQLSPEFQLLHLILHMGIYKCGIRDMMDVYNLLRCFPMNLKRLIPLLEQANAVEKAVFTLEIAELSAPGCARYILNELKPDPADFLMKRLHDRLALHRLTGDYQDAYTDYFQDVEKEVIYFNVFPQFHRKLYFYLKTIRLIFFPDAVSCRKLNDQAPESNISLEARMKTPWRIFSLIAQEIGWKFTCLLFLKLLVDLIISLKNYVIPATSYFDYLKSRNIDPEKIKKVVKNIQ